MNVCVCVGGSGGESYIFMSLYSLVCACLTNYYSIPLPLCFRLFLFSDNNGNADSVLTRSFACNYVRGKGDNVYSGTKKAVENEMKKSCYTQGTLRCFDFD